MDLGRRPEARFTTGREYLSRKIISWQDIDYTVKRISKFSTDNRAGIERTLHRISCIRNRQSLINGLTCRVGRAIFGTISVIRDLLESRGVVLKFKAKNDNEFENHMESWSGIKFHFARGYKVRYDLPIEFINDIEQEIKIGNNMISAN